MDERPAVIVPWTWGQTVRQNIWQFLMRVNPMMETAASASALIIAKNVQAASGCYRASAYGNINLMYPMITSGMNWMRSRS